MDRDIWGLVSGVNADSLDLKAQDATADQMQDHQLGSFIIRKRPEKIEVAILRKEASDLHFPREAQLAAPIRARCSSWCDCCRGSHSEALNQPTGRNKVRKPAAVLPRRHRECRRIDWQAMHSRRDRQQLELALWDNEQGRT